MRCENYPKTPFYDELIGADGSPRPTARALCAHLNAQSNEDLRARREAVDAAIMTMGITFTVYSDAGNIDRAWPFDLIPRIVAESEWKQIDAGLKQRLRALNMFIEDIYNEQDIIREGVFPAEVLHGSANYLVPCEGMRLRYGAWAHICGTDLVRGGDGVMYVLEDNLRVPSGVSYMLENRGLMKRLLPELFADQSILPLDDYTTRLYEMLASLCPRETDRPVVVVLTPGVYNSAYFEHSYLAQQMGAYLVEGSDLSVDADNIVSMRTVGGSRRVDVIYRRVDDKFIDPEVFHKDSVLGVPGLIRAWRAGKVAIANAPGSGVADDKIVYTYVPDMIRFYLNEEPILPNVPSYLCMREDHHEYVLAHLDELVVKPANESGGYGMLIGPKASEEERAAFAKLIIAEPRNYMAQPMLALSTVPTLIGDELSPRHVDLRPFILQGKEMSVTTGGLTRVAMREGSIVVNSSQGGGSKDTWIVREGV
ncbi:MAG: circularly permuted type 2 ATP-grasp protein [Pseudomonadota bacterium]